MIGTLNRIGAALVCAFSLAGACVGVAHLLVPDTAPRTPFLAIPGAALVPDAPTTAPIADRLAHASADRGAVLAARNCVACHTMVLDAPAGVGPNLFGVADRAVAASPGFTYSTALVALSGRWTAERLDNWLAGPQRMVPGTLMGFAGLPDPSERADLISFLQKQAAPADARPGPSAAGPSAAGTPAAGIPVAAAPVAGGDAGALVAGADPKAGGALAATQCGACHSFDQGGAAGVGPNLFGAAGRGIGQGPDYSYSPALSAHGGSWTVAALDSWLAAPQRFASGTRMGFPGIADPAQRAAVIAYLRTLHP